MPLIRIPREQAEVPLPSGLSTRVSKKHSEGLGSTLGTGCLGLFLSHFLGTFINEPDLQHRNIDNGPSAGQ